MLYLILFFIDGEDLVARRCCSMLVLVITSRIRGRGSRIGPVCVSGLVGHRARAELAGEPCTVVHVHLSWQKDLRLWDVRCVKARAF